MAAHRAAALTVATGLAALSAQLLAGVALADAPVKTGWWNAASVNGSVLPAPTTGADELHVSQGPTGAASFAAVAYDLTGQDITGATLQLKAAPDSAVGTTDVLACPTIDVAWKPGGNQPITAAPKYDCARGLPGIRAADGTTVTFLLGVAQAMPGGFSLAIVPAPDALPFTVDFTKPDATSLAPDAPPAEEPAPPETGFTAPPPDTSGTGSSFEAPFSPGTLPQTNTFVPPPPPVSAPVAPAPEAAPAPAFAPPPAAAAPLTPLSNRDRYQAGTLLALLAGALVYAWQQPSREPRRIGGLARADGPAMAVPVDSKPRGIGRFAVTRTAPARPLL